MRTMTFKKAFRDSNALLKQDNESRVMRLGNEFQFMRFGDKSRVTKLGNESRFMRLLLTGGLKEKPKKPSTTYENSGGIGFGKCCSTGIEKLPHCAMRDCMKEEEDARG